MVFPDYLKIIKDNRQNIIDYYVNQYGEDCRKMFEERFDRINFVFLVSPEMIDEYISENIVIKYVEESLEFLKEIGFDSSKMKIDEHGICIDFKDRSDELKARTILDGGSLGLVYDDIGSGGIWSFLDNSDVRRHSERMLGLLKFVLPDKEKLSVEDDIVFNRIKFLEDMGIKSKDIDRDEYIKSEDYKSQVEYFSRIALLAQKHKRKVESQFKELHDYGKELSTRIDNIQLGMERSLIKDEFYDMLSENDKKEVKDNPGFVCGELESYNLFFGRKPFSPGLIDYYSSECSDLLKSDKTKKSHKDFIINKRLDYLCNKGLEEYINKNEKLLSSNYDWYQIPEISSFLPKQEDANRVSELKKMSLSNYLVSKASMCVIAGNGIIGHNVTQALNMLKVGMEYNDLQTKNGEVQSVNIFLCPFDGNTPDVSLRHEIRHALTSSAKITNNGIEEVKIGNDISQYNDSTLVDRKYTDFNEVYTQKEAIDETIYSWNHGQYLINKPGDKLKLGNMSSYDYWIPRFQVIYDALPSSVKRSQIEDDNNSLYEFIPESVLSTVEELITDISVDDEEAIKRLYSIVDELKRNEEASIQL